MRGGIYGECGGLREPLDAPRGTCRGFRAREATSGRALARRAARAMANSYSMWELWLRLFGPFGWAFSVCGPRWVFFSDPARRACRVRDLAQVTQNLMFRVFRE